MDRVDKGFKDRMKKTQAIRMLGTGMDVGELNDYAHEICMLLLLNIFRREITDNSYRSRQDLISIVYQITRDMNIDSSRSNIERLVDGVIWYKDPKNQEPFRCKIYNEETSKHETYKFKYLKVDKEHTEWEKGGQSIYMLTEVSQEIVFLTREILEEFGFDLEQFYTLQLIKTGNFNKAQGSVDNLIMRVRTLIKREKEYKEDIIRNPQVIFFDKKRDKKRTQEEIKRQFEEEQRIFDDMFLWKDRVESFPEEQRSDADLVFEKLERARIMHNRLAKLVVQNMAYEVEIRVKYPETFWSTSNISFKKDIWQNLILKDGLPELDILENILNPLFSPNVEFIYPLDWAWEEQRLKRKLDFDEVALDLIIDDEFVIEEINWELTIDLWKYIFDEFLEKGRFSITQLQNIRPEEKSRWLSQSINIDIFMMFVITDIKLELSDNIDYDEKIDEALELFRRLCSHDQKYKKLIGKKVLSRLNDSDPPLKWDGLFISPYELYIEGEF